MNLSHICNTQNYLDHCKLLTLTNAVTDQSGLYVTNWFLPYFQTNCIGFCNGNENFLVLTLNQNGGF